MWLTIQRPGVFYGQCSELCGANHAFMPIVVEAVTPRQVRHGGQTEGVGLCGHPDGMDVRAPGWSCFAIGRVPSWGYFDECVFWDRNSLRTVACPRASKASRLGLCC